MPFNFLLCECLHPGKTGFGEAGKGARIKPEGGECVLVFGIDNEPFRKRFAVTKACDALFFYKSGTKGPVLFFVELKGSDISSAARQIGQALQAVRKKLLGPEWDYRAVVVTRKSFPKRNGDLRSRFWKEYRLELKICRSGNLREHL